MTEQEIYLERYDWTVHLIYDARSKDAEYIKRCLRDLGCSGVPLEDAYNLVLEGEANKGLTYSNISIRKTFVVIGWTSSKGEYVNSISHEMLHVVSHICEANMITQGSEEACYMMGGLMQASYIGYFDSV